MNAQRRHVGLLVFTLLGGSVLIWLGLWFGLIQLGLGLPGMAKIWPVFIVVAGLGLLVGFALNRRLSGLVLPGSTLLLLGLFLFPFALGVVAWHEMSRLWPVFPLLVGLAFLAFWMAGLGRHRGLLVPAFLGVVTGLFALMLTATPVGSLIGIVGWPVALLAPGAALLLAGLVVVALGTLRAASNH